MTNHSAEQDAEITERDADRLIMQLAKVGPVTEEEVTASLDELRGWAVHASMLSLWRSGHLVANGIRDGELTFVAGDGLGVAS